MTGQSRCVGCLIVAICFPSLLASCKREERGTRVAPPSAQAATQMVQVTDFHAGPPTTYQALKNPYEQNAYAMSEGQHLFEQYNCVGCHAHGGGDKGPPLMDDKWVYGGNPEQIYASIVQGRPNGMPSFRGRIPDFQVWQIVAYIRSLSGQVSKDAAPGREDHMQTGSPPNSVPQTQPRDTGASPGEEMPQ